MADHIEEVFREYAHDDIEAQEDRLIMDLSGFRAAVDELLKRERGTEIGRLLRVIETWITSESGPTQAKFSVPSLHLSITFRGYKKIILERNFPKVADQRTARTESGE